MGGFETRQIDFLQTVRDLGSQGVNVIDHQLGSTELTLPARKLILMMLSVVAERERDLLVERTQAGLTRAKSEAKLLGRPSKTTEVDRMEIIKKLEDGQPVSAVARENNVSRANIIGIQNNALNQATAPDVKY